MAMPIDPLKAHKARKGKIEMRAKAPLRTRADLSLWYTPGVGKVASYLGVHPEEAREYTMKGNSVLVVSDGSAVLGLGNIGPMGALPVMEGKAMIFKEFAGIDAIPIVLNTQDPQEVVDTIANIAPGFGGINLEDISAPRCFEIEEKLKARLDIPVFHDDQHGTAIVVLAGMINALKVARKKLTTAKIVMVGAGAAGNGIAKLLHAAGARNILMIDSKEIISRKRKDLDIYKKELAKITNPRNLSGTLADAMRGADVFIGVARANLVTEEMARSMAPRAIVFAMSNPNPEIDPSLARRAGALVVATGRSDYPNQINNSLVFPGLFRGALDNKVKNITTEMKLRAARKLASLVKNPSPEKIIPGPFDRGVAKAIASAIY
jgi:malate dehydrogenase (oxaloacetate-decarboxylating)